MYEKYLVVIPLENEGITVKKIKGVRYVYYTFDRNYSSEKHYTVPKATTIGKCDEATDGMMYPNANFFKFFPDAELPEGVISFREEAAVSTSVRTLLSGR